MTQSRIAQPRMFPWIATALLLAAAALLRLIRIRQGLPDFLEEAIPLRLALAMRDPATGHVDWNPHAFNYPSLSIYVHFSVQQAVFLVGKAQGLYGNWADYLLAYWRDPSPMVIASRCVGVVADVLAIAGLIRIGNRLLPGTGFLAAALAAILPTLIVTSQSIFCDSLMAVLAVWALERAFAWHDSMRTRHLVAAAILVGAAAGSKYPAAVLLAPLGVLIVHRLRARSGPALAAVAMLAAVAFVATTPFALLDSGAFLRDFAFEGSHARSGHFGSLERPSFGYHLGNLAHNLGWLGMTGLLGALVLFATQRPRRPEIAALWLAFIGFGLPISLARIDADRYLVPLLLIGSVLVAHAVLTLCSRTRATTRVRSTRVLAASALALLLLQPLWTGGRVATAGSTTTQLQAKQWLQAHLQPDEVLVQEGYGAPLVSRLQLAAAVSERAFAAAGPAARERLMSTPAYHVVSIPLGVAGGIDARFTDARGRTVELPVFTNASDLSAAFYEPGLYGGVAYFLTSSAVRDRYAADPRRYAPECAFYAALDSAAECVARFDETAEVSGPSIAIYRLGARWNGLVAQRTPGPLWWTQGIPPEYRVRAGAAVGPRATWVTTLTDVFDRHLGTFCSDMATELVTVGEHSAALPFSSALLAFHPDDPNAALIASICNRKLGRIKDAALVLDAAADAGVPMDAPFAIERARVSIAAGDLPSARRTLEAVLVQTSRSGPYAEVAQRLLLQNASASVQ